ncbi:MAG: LysR family transcriptional regulator [Bdellovibrionaceae bacterium]|nr:LysR family transcriptional regulator [Pseudobdellovibrionaceae bacterium]
MFDAAVDLNRIRLFLEIVRVGNITKTAELLNLQKSKVSRDLALLEQELGTQLIYRTTRQFSLTTEGQKFYDKAHASFEILNEAIQETSESSKTIAGHIAITCPEDIGQIMLIPLLEEFSKIYPKITYSLDFSIEVIDLVAHKIDLAIRLGHLKDSSLKMKKVGELEFGLYCSKSLYEALPEIIRVDQLKTLPTIYFQRSTKKAYWNLTCRGHQQKVEIQPAVRVNNFLSVYSFVQKGMGIGLLPKFIVNSDFSKGGIVQVLKEYHSGASDIQIIYAQQKELPTRVKVLSDFLVKKMKEKL